MSVWNKVLLVLILLTGVVHLQLASQRYMLAKEWEDKISKLEKKLSDTETSVAKLNAEVYGDRYDVIQEWHKMSPAAKLTRIRSLLPGSLWANCEVNDKAFKVTGDSVTASFKLAPQYEVTGIRPNGIVYVFDSGSPVVAAAPVGSENNVDAPAAPEASADAQEAPNAPKAEKLVSVPVFLGIFKISALNKTEISLTSVTTYTESDISRITESIKNKNSWIVCADRLPIDSPDCIVDWLRENPQLTEFLPSEMGAYFNRGSFVSSDITKFKAEELDSASMGKSRFAIDYNYILEQEYTKRDLFIAMIKRKQNCLADINTVLVDQLVMMGIEIKPEVNELTDKVLYSKVKAGNKLETIVAKRDRTKSELAAAEKERDFVKTKLDNASATLASIKAESDRLLAENCDLAVKIAKAQFMAAKRILQASGKAGKFSLENKKEDVL